jgi:hypothetical protein
MTAALAKAPPILRAASGEPPLGVGGLAFRDDQGEMHFYNREASPMAKLGVLELADGGFLAHPPGFRIDAAPFASRDQALRAAIARMIWQARAYARAKDGEGIQWPEGFAGRVIEWALGLKPTRKPVAAERNYWIHGDDDAVQLTKDPIVRHLVEEHRSRRAFPSKHPFSMTNPIEDGRILILATCKCGHMIKFGSGDQLRVDAAIEAHWRRHDFEPMVDGRGIPIIPGDGSRIPRLTKAEARVLKTRAEERAGGLSGEQLTPLPKSFTDPINAEERAGGSTEAPQPKSKRSRRRPPEADDIRELANAALPEPALFDAPCAECAVSPSPEPGAGGHSAPLASAPEITEPAGADASPSIADDLQGLRSVADADALRQEPAPSRPPDGAGLVSELAEFPGWNAHDDFMAIERGEGDSVDREQVRHYIGAGYVHATTKRMFLTEQGKAFLNPPAPIGAGSTEVSEPPLFPALSNAEADPVREAGLGGGSLALVDDDDLTIAWPSYDTFLEDKIVTAPLRGIEVARDALHPYLKPHCKDLTVWALRLGCAAIFASFGLHKTAMQLEWCRQLCKHTGQPTLSVVPLGVRHGFIKEAMQFDMDIRFIRTTEELDELYCEGVRHFLTNYESIREGKLDPNQFEAVTLDEASVLRSYGSKTFQEFLPLFAKVPFKLVATATPSPNRYKELIHYAGFLGVMDTGLALTRWFQRNSEKAGDLTLYPHKEDEFWMWVHSWAAFLQKPSELGHSDDGYELPPLKLNWHEVPADHSKAEPERDGQGVMFRAVASSLSEAAKARRDSLAPRVAKMLEIIAQDPEAHRIIWHDLEAEREAIEQALPEVVTISGSMDIDAREARLHDFEEGRIKWFGTKPILSGSGSNFQYFCHKAIYVALPGYGYKFNDFIQSLYRLQRFGQAHPVEVDIIYSEDERAGRAALEEKWARDTEMRGRMSEIIRAHGLNTLPLRDALLRSIGVKRVEVRGERFTAINNDAVAECRAWPENSVDLMVSSIPFGTQYEYSASYHDFGHSDDSGHFWSQMDFLSSELLRMLKPGRLACIHVKDRVLFGSVTGEGVPTISPFHAEAIMHYRAHGFQYLGMITVVTDVVRENNQTYRLGWSENAKDGTKMGCGMPEYILLFRKPQSNRLKSYADVPVTKSKDDYTRARWQIDAHGLWRSSGNRHLTPEEFATCSSADLAKLFAKTSAERVYDFEAHVRIGEEIERTGTLPATFMAIAPGSHHPDVWHDVNRMRTLNMNQKRKGQEMHLCPLQFDIVDRLIERYSNPDDLVFDPFGGLMTVPYRALLKGRRGAATELSASYFMDGVNYLRAAEEKMTTPQLFDLATFDAVNTPPSDEMTEAET